jgi:hypothetical protein
MRQILVHNDSCVSLIGDAIFMEDMLVLIFRTFLLLKAVAGPAHTLEVPGY